MAFDWGFFWHYLLEPSTVYLHGLWLTLSLSVISQGLGTLIGLFAALGRLSRFRVIQGIVRFYVWVMRGTPLLVQIVFIYTGLRRATSSASRTSTSASSSSPAT